MNLFSFALLACILLIAVVTDLRSHRIPNWLVYPAMAVGIGFNTVLNGTSGLLFSLQGLGLGLVLLLFFYLSGGMGAGDVKLLAAAGSFLGPEQILTAFLGAALIGGFYALTVIGQTGHMRALRKRYGQMARTFISTHKVIYIPPDATEKQPVLCYGLAIAFGASLSMGLQYFRSL